MYDDHRPCRICGARVEVGAREPDRADLSSPVGPADGVVGSGDPTVDRRTCTNDDCPSHQDESLDV